MTQPKMTLEEFLNKFFWDEIAPHNDGGSRECRNFVAFHLDRSRNDPLYLYLNRFKAEKDGE